MTLRQPLSFMMLILMGTCCVSICKGAEAQGIQDLFARPQTDGVNDLFDRPGDAKRKATEAVRPLSRPVASPSDMTLRPDNGSAEARRYERAMEIRQARAMRRAAERTARLEAARWSGSSTLRPSWNPDPFTASRFPNQHTFLIPVYIYR